MTRVVTPPDDTIITKQNSPRSLEFRRLLADKPDLYEQVCNYTMLGASGQEIAILFGTTHDTWLFWVKHSQELRDAITEGGALADAKVAAAMYKRAVGYEFPRQRLVVNNKTGHAVIHNLTEHVPPDPTAGKFWLTNRAANKWRERQQVDHSGNVEIDSEITIKFVDSKAELLNITPLPALSHDNDEA